MKKRRKGIPGWIYSLIITGVLTGFAIWRGGVWLGTLAAFLAGVVTFSVFSVGKAKRLERERKTSGEDKSSPLSTPDSVAADGRRAVSELLRLKAAIKAPEVREKIDRLITVSSKILKDAEEDPSDVPRIRKFLDYYLPTTLKLLRAYESMEKSETGGENVQKSMESISAMLDTAAEAYEKQLDALFENQALDIETDISVLNSLLTREGLSGGKGYDDIISDAARGSASAVQQKEE